MTSPTKLAPLPQPRYLPYLSGDFRLAMGLVALDLGLWIEPDEQFVPELREKDGLLVERHGEVVGCRQGSEAAQREVLDLLIAHMVRYYPDLLRDDGQSLTVPPTGAVYRRDDWHDAAIDLAGRLVQEDFCLMAPGEGGYTLEAASLCFPSRWRLAEKLGQPMSIIHDPVPGFGDKLARPVDRFFDHLGVDRPVWRVNWSLNDDPTLFQPVRRQDLDTDEAVTAANAGDRLFIRCERQTLRRLPSTGWILFTIKTYVDPIASLATRPDAAAGLASAVRQLPEGTRRYKNIAPYQQALLDYLDGLAAD
ncbi:MAG: DUF3445 domain-containing protein [Alphaproteobacteria bacterium]|jgi:hypothetical protein|nr:DUF3445 domain-containing protein [Alphaproteobacteria bacterium]